MTKSIITKEQVPELFPILWDKLTENEADHQALALLIANLHNMGCDKDTIKILTILGEFKSWQELVSAKYEPRDYHDLGISVFQAVALFNGIAHSLKRKRLLSDKPDQKTLRFSLIKSIFKREQHSRRSTTASA
ncbi:MAG: hypothetical protein WDA75_21090 [Candidatus Latescibacterota bacterium]|jgi:hypothetical protein